jgi:aspartyl-tRNA(Asn)/glutamyl-tRNA(Gln) amidotransferase subunit C
MRGSMSTSKADVNPSDVLRRPFGQGASPSGLSLPIGPLACNLTSVMQLSKEDVQSIAMLARIGLTEEETDQASRDLGAILGYVERLQNVDTTGVPEAAAPAVEAVDFRPDAVDAATDVERSLILDNFPASEGGFLKAPAVFEKPKR